MNNQRAIDISRRLASISDSEREDNKKDRLCIDLLEQAERKHTIPSAAVLNAPSTEEELMSMLLYLENRGIIPSAQVGPLTLIQVTCRFPLL